VLAGGLEPRALQFVREWAALRQKEIMANWERARRNEPLLGIEPVGKAEVAASPIRVTIKESCPVVF
jgi:hypothetical protein